MSYYIHAKKITKRFFYMTINQISYYLYHLIQVATNLKLRLVLIISKI